jgi:hypothetical protein
MRADGRACSLGGELTPPYAARYLESIEEFLRYGIDILVVDSSLGGPGGVLEMADRD